jgi:hypothetical protein
MVLSQLIKIESQYCSTMTKTPIQYGAEYSVSQSTTINAFEEDSSNYILMCGSTSSSNFG